ncbi:hypothetical protein ACFLS1_02345 [Verrucomicrobiota bacterium]
MKYIAFILMSIAIIGCFGCGWPSERTCYKAACKAVRADTNLPPEAVLYPMDQVEFYMAKNAGSIELPYEYTDDSGNTVTGNYTVHLKRVARTWTVDKCYPAPKY